MNVKQKLVSIFLLLFSSLSIAQNINWEQLNSVPATVNDFEQMNNTIFSATNNGLFYKTVDESTWQLHPDFDSQDEIIDLDIIDGKLLVQQKSDNTNNATFLLTRNYSLKVSSDNGQSFQTVLNTNYNYELNTFGCYRRPYNFDIQVIDDQVTYLTFFGYPDCDNSPLFKGNYTTDGGITWNTFNTPMFTHATSDGNGTYYLAREDSMFVSTDPSFSSYTSYGIPMPPRYIVQENGISITGNNQLLLEFEYSNDALYAFYVGKLWTSVDQGISWQEDAIPDVSYPNSSRPYQSVELLKDGYFYFQIGDQVFRTQNPIEEPWEVFELDTQNKANISEEEEQHFYGLSYLDAGYFYSRPALPIYHSVDGINWTNDNWEGSWNTIQEARRVGDEIWLDSGGQVYRTEDNASSWTLLPLQRHESKTPIVEHQSYYYAFDLEGWTTEQHFPLSRSSDMGLTWNSVDMGLSCANSYTSPNFYFSGDTIFIYKENGLISYSFNHYDNPALVAFPGIGNRTNIIFLNDNIIVSSKTHFAYASGPYYSSTIINPPIPEHSILTIKDFSLNLWSSDKWYSVLKDGSIFTSTDEGDTWLQTGRSLISGNFGNNSVENIIRDGEFLIMHYREKTSAFPADLIKNTFWISRDDGIKWTQIEVPDESIIKFIKDGFLYASDNLGLWRTSIDAVKALVPDETIFGILEGQVVVDKNDDCENDNTDGVYSGQIIEITPGPYYSIVDANGNYRIAVPEGTYNITSKIPDYHTSCIDTTLTGVVVDSSTTTSNLDFIMQPIPGINDLEVNLTSLFAARTGFSFFYRIKVTNHGTESMNDIPLNLIFDENLLTYQYSDGQLNGHQVNWMIDSLAAQESVSFSVSYKVIGFTGDYLKAEASVPVVFDKTPYNNKDVHNMYITVAVDPNDKQDLNDKIYTPGEQPYIDYLIRFQNTGTDTAFTVVITDVLSEDLDLLTLETIDASHPYKSELSSDRVATWTFDNILLPDSTTNEPASHGYVRFRIQTNRPLFDGEQIENTASIFFDFNAAVITNTEVSSFEKEIFQTIFEVGICQGDTLDGILFEEDITIIDTIQYIEYDTILITNYEVYPSYNLDFEIDTCGDFTPYSLYYTTQLGCDSIVNYIQAPIQEIPIFEFDEETCEDTYDFNGQIITQSGTYQSTLQTSNGCDSIVMLNIAFLEEISLELVIDTCIVDIAPGTFEVLVGSGCGDTLYIYNNNIGIEDTVIDTTICEGEVYSIAGIDLTETGEYIYNFTTLENCDSLVIVNLEVLPISISTQDITILEGQYYNDILIENDTTLIDTFTASNGCDSIIYTMIFAQENTTSTAELQNQIGLEVLPNPFKDNIQIELKIPYDAQLSILLFNLLGQPITEINFENQVQKGNKSFIFSTNSLPQGAYWLQIHFDNKVITKKLIK